MTDRPRRRLHIRVNRESMVEIDEEALERHYGPFPTVRKLERALVEPIEDGDGTVDSLAATVGVEGRYDKYHDTEIDIEIEEECAKHGVWFGINPGSLGYCWRCRQENLMQKGKKKR